MDDKELYQILSSYVEATRDDKEVALKKLVRHSQSIEKLRQESLYANRMSKGYSRPLSYFAYRKVSNRRYRNAE